MHFQSSTILLMATAACLVHGMEEEPVNLDVSNRYIVVLKDNADMVEHMHYVQGLHAQVKARDQDSQAFDGVTHNYNISSFQAYAGHFPNSVISQVSEHDAVSHVEPDTLWATEQDDMTLAQQPKAPKGLRMISHRPKKQQPNPEDEKYIFDQSAGDGTFAYIIDTGIYTQNADFGPRAKNGFNVVAPKNPPAAWTDTAGHGTHIAGIIGGKTFGVAKRSQLIGVKVIQTNKGPLSHVLAGFEWATKDITSKRRQPKAVISMSLWGPLSPAMNKAIDIASAQGVTTVDLAGNGGKMLPRPEHGLSAIKVSATNFDYGKAKFANWGGGVDIFAPGVNIMSTLNGKPGAQGVKSGTAQASAFVSGLVLYFKKLHPLNDAKTTKQFVLGKAVPGVVVMPGGRKMPFAYNGSGK